MMQIKLPVPSRTQLEEEYLRYADLLDKAVFELQRRLRQVLHRGGLTPTIKYRIKSFDSYYQKMLRRVASPPKTRDWFTISDILGIRVVCPFMADLPLVESLLANEFQVVEREKKGAEFSFKEFGYDSLHYLVQLPQDIQDFFRLPEAMVCEVQLRTILQDAWAEVEHELVYKSDHTPFDESLRRKLAALNANLSLADMIFHEIREYQRELHRQLKKRRLDFWDLVKRSEDNHFTDAACPNTALPEQTCLPSAPYVEDDIPTSGMSGLPHYDVIDGQLLKAIYAHNAHYYDDAIRLYTEILSLQPRGAVRSIVYVHRGMAYFAKGNYEHAILDFSTSMEMEGDHRKALYYRAVANRQLKCFGKALDDLNRCLQLDPYQSEVLLSRAQTHAHLGDYSAALSDVDATLVIDPAGDEARKFRNVLTEKLGI